MMNSLSVACTMARTRDSWTGVTGAVRAVVYHAGITPGEAGLRRAATRPDADPPFADNTAAKGID